VPVSQAVSPPPLAAKAGVRSQAILREICGEQCGIGTGFSPVSIIPPVLHTHFYALFLLREGQMSEAWGSSKSNAAFFFFLNSWSIV